MSRGRGHVGTDLRDLIYLFYFDLFRELTLCPSANPFKNSEKAIVMNTDPELVLAT